MKSANGPLVSSGAGLREEKGGWWGETSERWEIWNRKSEERKRRGEMEDGWRGATWKWKRAAAGLKLGQSAINGERHYRAGTIKWDSVCRPRPLPTCVHHPLHVSHVFSPSKDIFDQVYVKQVHFEKDHMSKAACLLHLITENNLDLPFVYKKRCIQYFTVNTPTSAFYYYSTWLHTPVVLPHPPAKNLFI